MAEKTDKSIDMELYIERAFWTIEYDKVHYAGYSLKEVEVILDPNVVPAASLT